MIPQRNELFNDMKAFAASGREARGAVFTRAEVVDFILNLVGYAGEAPLSSRILEPSFGDGDFLLPIVARLLQAFREHGGGEIVAELRDAVRAVEVNRQSIETTRGRLFSLFQESGVASEDALELIRTWIVEGDFLLAELPSGFTHVVGNPPYVRQEMVPDRLLAEYRARYATIYDRADLYIPFIERSLKELSPGGSLGFICSDRWMKNRYGGPLRALVAGGYHLAIYVDMVDTPAFLSEVTAYPAITVITKEKPGATRIAHRPPIEASALKELACVLTGGALKAGSSVVEAKGVVQGSEPWLLQSFDQVAVVRRLEEELPTLEEAGCKVGIGVATGADRVYIAPFDELDVEQDCKIPLVTTKDMKGGTVEWRGMGVLNPFNADGSLVDLKAHPRFARYLQTHVEAVRGRNCAKKNPHAWYRTIDRIYPALVKEPKLLIPDIKGEAHVVYEEGHFYPHHNLYYVTSAEWDLRALQAVLLSGIAKLFVSTYSVQMRGGYLRFQAQYLRRIRLPLWRDVPAPLRKTLAQAAKQGDREACNRAVYELYRLSAEERAAIGGNGI